jgi:hypothetical protein
MRPYVPPAVLLQDAYAFGDAPPPSAAPIQTRTVTSIRLTPCEAWEAFIGADVSVLDFFELHRGYTLRGYINAMLAELPEADRTAVGDLVIAYARATSVVR